MPLIKQVDVKNYLADRRQRANRKPSTSVPDATGTSETDAGLAKPDLPRPESAMFAEDFFAKHFPATTIDPSIEHVAVSVSSQALATSKSAQA
jgi:hypothetical protein